MRTLILLLLGPCLWAAPVVKTVCASGCDYTNAELQTALNDAQRGWILELAAGENFDTATSFYLPAKTGPGWITIRSSRLAELPAGKRVSPADADKMPKLRTSGTYYTQTIQTSGEPSSYWRLEGLEITLTAPGLGNRGNLIQLGGSDEDSPEKISHHFVIDRCYLHGFPFDQGPWRAILHNADHVVITNNYMDEIKLLASTAESHVLGSWSHNGALEVRNNYLGGAAINSLVGGAWPYVNGMYPMFLRYAGNHYFKPGTHQVIRYRADPVGTVLPTAGHLSQSQPARGQTFWKSDTSEFYVAWADPVDGDPWSWHLASGVASNRVCIDGSFWRNESATPRYWECQSGNWVEVFSDRTVTGITGAFNGWGIKNQWEIKGATGVWKEGNITENTFYPTFGNQVGASHLLNWLPQQGGPASTIRDIYVRNNKSRRTAMGPSTGKIIVDATVTSATPGSPTVLTCSGGTSMGSSGLKSVIIRNATGEWAGINGRWLATRTSSTTFEIPYNSTGFGSLTGSPSVKVQDETISMRHLWPSRLVFENNIWESMGEAANMAMSDCCASISATGGYAYSVAIGRTAQLGFPGSVFAHNTVIKPHNGPTVKMGAGVAPYKLSWAGALGDVPTRANQWRDNLEETGQVVVNNSDEGEVGCDYAIANQWPDAWIDKNVLVQTGQYAISANTSYYDQMCPTWAWPWARNGSGIRGNVTGGEVTADVAHCAGAGGNRLTLTLDLGHGLFPNTVFDVTAATPGDIVGRYVVPSHRYSDGLLVTQTQGTLEVCTAAPVGSYSGIAVEASAGYTDYTNGNFRLAASSQYKGFATDGSDPGANQDVVKWATETAESGEVNPYLDMGVKTFIPSPGGGEFRFTAYSNNACTWQISSTRAFADSLGSVSQTRTGRYGVATVSGLGADHYWYKVTCDGGRYRDGEFVVTKEAAGYAYTYYVDSASGLDSNDGRSPGQAFQTIAKVNTLALKPGESVGFKRGGVWRETLMAPSSGAAGQPITFDAYGTGAKPIITGNNVVTGWTQDTGNADYGDTSFGGGDNIESGGYVYYYGPIQVPSGGEVQNITLRVVGATGVNSKAALYTDSSGVPANLVANSITDQRTLTAGTNTFVYSGTKPTVSDGASYWLAVHSSANWDTPWGSGGTYTRGYQARDYASGFPASAAPDGSYPANNADRYFTVAVQNSSYYYKTGFAANPIVIVRDGQLQGNVDTKAELDTGKWYWDSSTQRVYLFGDPTADVVEIASRDRAAETTGKDYITFSNLQLEGGDSAVFRFSTGSDNCIIQDSIIKNGLYGIETANQAGGAYNQVLGSLIEWTVLHGIAVSTASPQPGWVFKNNEIHHVGHLPHEQVFPTDRPAGLLIYGTPGPAAPVVENNYIHDNGLVPWSDHGLYLDNTDGIVRFNAFHGNVGAAVKARGAADVLVAFNVMYDNQIGIQVEYGSPNVEIYHNTIYANNRGTDGGLGLDIRDTGTSVDVRNNIIAEHSYQGSGEFSLRVISSAVVSTSDYNLIWRSAGGDLFSYGGSPLTWAEWQGQGFDSYGVNADPKLTDPGAGDFTLQSSSPAVDAGVAIPGVNDSSQGTAPDLGRFESPYSRGGDTTPPTVSMTAPPAGNVSGMVAVSATANDNVGVVGVQFKLDGVNLGAEDTGAPYSIQWDTTQETNGPYALTAVARDAANNSTTSGVVNVTVNNGGDLGGFYASSTGTGTACTYANPCHLVYALRYSGSLIQPGDTLWLRGGTHEPFTYNPPNWWYISELVGTAQNPIIIRAYPGERVIVDGGIETSNNARHNWFWGLEVTDSRPFDQPGTSRLVSAGGLKPGFNFLSGGVGAYPGHKVIHCYVRNTGHPGIGFWNMGTGGEVYGSYIMGSGTLDDTLDPPNVWVRGAGVYGQNDSTSEPVSLERNIWFKQFTVGIKMYGEGGQVRGVTSSYNISFVNEDEDLWHAATTAGNLEAVTIDHNYTWKEPTDYPACGTQVGFGGDQISTTITNNYLVSGYCGTDTALFTRSVDAVTVTGNTVVAPDHLGGDYYPSDDNHSSVTWDNNAYYGGIAGQEFWTDRPSSPNDWQNWAEWKADNGYDANSTYSASLPTTNQIFVFAVNKYKDQYEPGRGHIAVYNWQNLDSVNVDLSPSGITSGQSYQVYDAECLTACSPVASGTYNGSPVSFPMTMTAQDQVTGEQNYNEARIFNHTSKRFNAFVVRYQ